MKSDIQSNQDLCIKNKITLKGKTPKKETYLKEKNIDGVMVYPYLKYNPEYLISYRNTLSKSKEEKNDVFDIDLKTDIVNMSDNEQKDRTKLNILESQVKKDDF